MIISIKPWLEIADQFHHGFTGPSFLTDNHSNVLPAVERFSAGGQNYRSDGGNRMGQKNEFYHKSVLAQQVLDAMQPVAGKQIFDGTLGGGGHSEMLLDYGAHVIGCDQDSEALDHASQKLERFGDRFLPVKGNFKDMDRLLGEMGVDSVDGILLDLGVSSRQLDRPERGFSFQKDGPLDMRMNSDAEISAKELVNGLDEGELVKMFFDYGQESRSRKVAAAIVEARKTKEICTTRELSDIVAAVIPRTGPKNPATKVFQALRIAVNKEMECLEAGIEKAVNLLSVGGVLAVISFHSLEDRKVKRFLRHRSNPSLDRPEWPEPRVNPDYCLRLPSRRAIMPMEEEVKVNPRARSARLRVAVKL